LEAGLAHIQHLPFDSAAAIAAARIRVELEKQGSTIRPLDLPIAGTAVSRGAAPGNEQRRGVRARSGVTGDGLANGVIMEGGLRGPAQRAPLAEGLPRKTDD